MMSPFDLLSGLGSLSSLLSLGMQINDLSGKEDKNLIALRSFEAITSVAFRWKHVHNKYHLLLNDVSHINEFCINTNKENVSVGAIAKLLKNLKTLEQKAPTFRRDVDLYISREVREVAKATDSSGEIIGNINKRFGDEIGIKAQEMFYAQNDVIKSHDATCAILDKFIPYLRSDVQPAKVGKLYDNIKPLYKSFHQVILHTDEILINTIDFYDIVYGASDKW